jgi:predicted nucleic acid-binding Zn ribbon protein
MQAVREVTARRAVAPGVGADSRRTAWLLDRAGDDRRPRRVGGVRPLPGTPTPLRRVGDALDRVLAGLGAPTSAGIEAVFDHWAEVVGETMAARTRPATIDGETLVVACDDPALATHVRFLEPQLVARIGELAGERRIRRVEVRIDGGRRRGPRPPRGARRGR